MVYTYDDFLTKLNQSGLQGQFSQADMDTALLYPEFGMSMISAKQNYANAQTQEGRDMANALAEQLRMRGILVRHFKQERVKDYLRITIGAMQEMQALEAAIEMIFGRA